MGMVAAVRFTTLGDMKLGDCCEQLQNLIFVVHQKLVDQNPGVERFHLFGRYKVRDMSLSKAKTFFIQVPSSLREDSTRGLQLESSHVI
jgi:hypothetical protein